MKRSPKAKPAAAANVLADYYAICSLQKELDEKKAILRATILAGLAQQDAHYAKAGNFEAIRTVQHREYFSLKDARERLPLELFRAAVQPWITEKDVEQLTVRKFRGDK